MLFFFPQAERNEEFSMNNVCGDTNNGDGNTG